MNDFLLRLGTATGSAFLLQAALALPAQASGAPERWVHGSWVNVRATASASGAIVDHLTTNTPVVLHADGGGSCQVSWRVEGREGRGYVPCKLLGERPLVLADVALPQRPDGTSNPQYSPPRAFWIAPSMEALFAVGNYFTDTLLSPAQRKLEQEGFDNQSSTPPRLVRYPLAEFDAMKAVLAKGIVASGGATALSASCDDVQGTAPEPPGTRWRESGGRCRLPGLSLRLPKAGPSLFKDRKQLLPGSAGIETISAHFGIVERGRVLGGPRWERDYDHMRYTGAWDIGRYELTLDRPVVEHVIGRTGLVGASQWTPQERITPFGPSESCAGGFAARRRGKQILPDYPVVKDALMWFQTTQALPFMTAAIRKSTVPGRKRTGPDDDSITRVGVFEIDLDRDGIPDFVQWDIWGIPEIEGTQPILARRAVYVNIDGRWYPFDQDDYGECT